MRIAPQRKRVERAVINAWHGPAPWLFCTLANTHFQVIYIPPMERQVKMSPYGMVFFYKDGFPSQVQIPKGYGAEFLGLFSGWKLFC